MMVFNCLIFLLVFIVGLCIMPIWLATGLQLKSKNAIIGLAVASILTFGVGGIISYILIMVDIKQERILDDNINYNHFLYNYKNHMYSNDMFGWGVYILFYILEFLVILMPIVNIPISQEQSISLNLFSMNDIMTYLSDSEKIYVAVSVGVYAIYFVIICGVLIHIIVRDTRKTVFMDNILQAVYMASAFVIAIFCFFGDPTGQYWGAAMFFMPLMVLMSMMTAVLPQTFSLIPDKIYTRRIA